MTLTEFLEREGHSFQGALHALWLAHQGEWEQAHQIAQSDESHEGAWVHAYLHRVEGDSTNASYWYRRAGRPPQSGDLKEEWKAIATGLLAGPETDAQPKAWPA